MLAKIQRHLTKIAMISFAGVVLQLFGGCESNEFKYTPKSVYKRIT